MSDDIATGIERLKFIVSQMEDTLALTTTIGQDVEDFDKSVLYTLGDDSNYRAVHEISEWAKEANIELVAKLKRMQQHIATIAERIAQV